MGFIIKEVKASRLINKKINEAFSFIGQATEKEITVIDSMRKFYKRNKYLTEAQLSYLEVLVDGLKRKNVNARFRIG